MRIRAAVLANSRPGKRQFIGGGTEGNGSDFTGHSLGTSTPLGGVVPVGELVRVERTVGPDQIRRVDRRRTITLVVTPPPDLSLEETPDHVEFGGRAGAAR